MTHIVGVLCAGFSVVAVLCSMTVPPAALVVGLVGVAIMVGALFRIAATGARVWTLIAVIGGLGALIVLTQSVTGAVDRNAIAAGVLPLAAGGLASLVISQHGRPAMLALVIASGVAAVVVIAWTCRSVVAAPVGGVILGWMLVAVVASWVSRSVPSVAKRIHSIGDVHRAERQASETEAQRRQGARLLHDTVLATLTLLAHSGIGVSEEALREQAAEDARLLRHLRLGTAPPPTTMNGSDLAEPDEQPLGQTLESVKQRFGRMGLEVEWHGTGQVLLPSDVLDAFLLALAECLENIRRHAGVPEAHVTIVHDDRSVRAVVTDSGVGFEPDEVAAERLGYTESVLGRLREVGGDARLFSAPGAGTTVVLEAPR